MPYPRTLNASVSPLRTAGLQFSPRGNLNDGSGEKSRQIFVLGFAWVAWRRILAFAAPKERGTAPVRRKPIQPRWTEGL